MDVVGKIGCVRDERMCAELKNVGDFIRFM